MQDQFHTSSKVPTRNADLLAAHNDAGKTFLSVDVIRLSKGLFPATYKISVPQTGKVIAADETLLEDINKAERAMWQQRRLQAGLPHTPDDEDPREKSFPFEPVLSRAQHYELYTEHRQQHGSSPHGFPFTVGVGGFVFIGKRGEAPVNDRPQFVMKQDGIFNPGTWSQPSGLVGCSVFKEMGRHIASQIGIVLLDDDKKIATVVAPRYSVDCPENRFLLSVDDQYYTLSKELAQINGEEIKKAQLPHIKAELEKAGYGDYRIEVTPHTLHLMRDKLPLQDKLTLTVPADEGRYEQTFRAFVVKDGCGSVKINMPFHVDLPADQKILTIDCEGKGRQTALKTQDQLQAMENEARAKGQKALTKDIGDWIGRTQQPNYIPNTKPNYDVLNSRVAVTVSPDTPTFK